MKFFLGIFFISLIAGTIGKFNQDLSVPDNTQLWSVANAFTNTYNAGDIQGMNKLLPDGFMLQWLHENFLEKKALLAFMADPACHALLIHSLTKDSTSSIRYSDNFRTASLNVRFNFLNPAVSDALETEKRYGLCLMYFYKHRAKWRLQTVHLDLHCLERQL